MSGAKDVRWGKRLGAVAGLFVLFKASAFVLAGALRLASSEVQARGSDVAYVLGLVERRSAGRG